MRVSLQVTGETGDGSLVLPAIIKHHAQFPGGIHRMPQRLCPTQISQGKLPPVQVSISGATQYIERRLIRIAVKQWINSGQPGFHARESGGGRRL